MRNHNQLFAFVALLTIPLMGAAISCTTAMGETVTLAGCLQTADEPGTFELDPVTEASQGVDTGAVELVPADEVDLSAHVGHEVRITGEKMDTAGAHDEGDERGYDAENTGLGTGEKLHVKVTELEHVSATCIR